MDHLDTVVRGRTKSIVHYQTLTDISEATKELQTRCVFDLGDTKLDYSTGGRWVIQRTGGIGIETSTER